MFQQDYLNAYHSQPQHINEPFENRMQLPLDLCSYPTLASVHDPILGSICLHMKGKGEQM